MRLRLPEFAIPMPMPLVLIPKVCFQQGHEGAGVAVVEVGAGVMSRNKIALFPLHPRMSL